MINNCTIYKICCFNKEVNDVYVGSTRNFAQRRNEHKYNCNNPNSKKHHYKLYQFIRDNGNWCNFNMEIIEILNVKDKNELLAKEREYYEILNSTLNQLRPFRTAEEFKVENAERCRLYYLEHKEHLLDLNKQWRERQKLKINHQELVQEPHQP